MKKTRLDKTGYREHTRVYSLLSMSQEVFDEKRDSSIRAERFKKARHWKKSEEAEIIKQGRKPYSIPLIANKLSMLLSTERQMKTSFRVEALADTRDEAKAELATMHLQYKERETDFGQIESEVFDSGISVNFGVVEIYSEFDRKTAADVVKLRRVDWQNVIWDVNARDYLLRDATWMAKKTSLTLGTAKSLYPGKEIIAGEFGVLNNENRNQAMKTEDEDKDIVELFDVWEKRQRSVFTAVIEDDEKHRFKTFTARTEKKALELADDYIDYVYVNREPPNVIVYKDLKEYIDHYLITPTLILEHEETDMEDFPLVVYRAGHYEGQWWTVADLLGDTQIFIDRLFGQIDKGLGQDIKSITVINKDQLADGYTADQLRDLITETNPVIYTSGEMTQNAVQQITGKGFNYQYLNLIDQLKMMLEDLSGGRAFQGLGEGQLESGAAIVAKQKRGQLLTDLYINNLRRWRQEVGRRLLTWMRKYENGRRTFRVLNEGIPQSVLQELEAEGYITLSTRENGAFFVTTPDSGTSYLDDFEWELTITEVAATQTEKEETFRQLSELYRQNPEAINPATLISAHPNVDKSIKDNILQEQQSMIEARAQAQNFEHERLKKELEIKYLDAKGNYIQGVASAVASLARAKEMKTDTENKKIEGKTKGFKDIAEMMVMLDQFEKTGMKGVGEALGIMPNEAQTQGASAQQKPKEPANNANAEGR